MGSSPLSSRLRGGMDKGEAKHCRSRDMPSAAVDKERVVLLQDSKHYVYIKKTGTHYTFHVVLISI